MWRYFIYINSLPNDKNVGLSKLKALADNKINMVRKFKSVLGRVENTVGKLWEKEKMLVTSIFSFSHNVFKRLFFQGR